MTTSKRALMCLLAAVLVLCAGCGGSPTVSMFDLRTAMLAADPSLPEMTSVSHADEHAAELFAYLSELDYGKVDAFFLSYSSVGKADEIAVVAVKDPADVTAAKDTLLRHRDKRIALYRQYDPKQEVRAKGALIFTQERYAVLIICDRPTAVKAAFTTFLKESGAKNVALTAREAG